MVHRTEPPQLPGVVPEGGPEGTLEWVRRGGGVLGEMAARLGSDAAAEGVVRPVIAGLRTCLPAETWDGIVDELPFSLRRMLRSPGQPRPAPVDGWDGLVRQVSAAIMHPPARAVFYVRAVLACLKSTLPRGLVDAVERELPAELAAAWRTAR